jgi:pyruvate kinase
LCKNFIGKYGYKIPVIAKLEKYEVFQCLEKIINISDGVMVARGDLGVEIPIEEVPVRQKEIISICNLYGKPVITATQMLESMINSYRPTRAEVADVANAVLDGTDAVMLSGETSVGKYPLQTVNIMNKVAKISEVSFANKIKKPMLQKDSKDPNDDLGLSVALSAVKLSESINASAIICFTESGSTPARVSRFKPSCPIISYSANPTTRRRVNLFWGVYSKDIPNIFFSKDKKSDLESLIQWVIQDLTNLKRVKKSDKIIIVAGVPLSKTGITNTLRIVEV